MTADWMVRRRVIDDQAMRQRLISVVDQAVAKALPGQSESDTHDGVKHTAAWWSWRQEGDTSAQKTVHPGGDDFQIRVEHDGPDEGPWMFVTTRDADTAVLFMPGLEFEEPGRFLDWFEDES